MFPSFQDKQKLGILERLTTASRLRFFAVIFLSIWVVVYFQYHLSTKSLVNGKGVVIGSDFITFYFAGTIIKDHDGKNIYNPDYQKQIQDGIVAPEKMEGLLFFINPAWTAAFYSIFAYLPYRLAFHLHTVLMAFCFMAGVWILQRRLQTLSTYWLIIGSLGMAWFPMAKAITGGQNAAFIFLLLCCGYSALADRKSVLAGVSFGVLLFKPQYALPIIGLLSLKRKWTIIAVAFLTGFCQYLAGAYFCGFDWPLKMMNAIKDTYQLREGIAGGATHISINEVMDYSIIHPLRQFRGTEPFVKVISLGRYLLIVAGIIFLMTLWRRSGYQRGDFRLLWAFTIAAILLISLHTQYYDASLLVLSVILILDYQKFKGYGITATQRLILISAFFLFPVYLISGKIGFQPLIILPVYVCWWALKNMTRENGFKKLVGSVK